MNRLLILVSSLTLAARKCIAVLHPETLCLLLFPLTLMCSETLSHTSLVPGKHAQRDMVTVFPLVLPTRKFITV